MEYWPLYNNPKIQKLTLETPNGIYNVWGIQIWDKGDIYFYPDSINSLYFTDNWKVQSWPIDINHISFHRNWQVHIWKDKHILDKSILSSGNNSSTPTRNKLIDIKSQILFKIRIPDISILSSSISGIWQINLKEDLINWPYILSVWLVDWLELSNALTTWIDPYWLCFVSPSYENTAMYGFGICKNSKEIPEPTDYAKKFIFIVVRPYEQSIIENFDDYPYIMTIPNESIVWTTPY